VDIVLISHTMDYICRSYYTDMEKLSQYIESLIFVSDQPIGFKLIKESLENHFETKMDTESIEAAIDDLIEKYQDERFAIEIVEINNVYSTSEKFMEYFGLKDMTDMPKIKDFKLPESQVGEPAPLEEEVNTSAPSEEIAEVEAQLGEQEAPILGPPSEEE